jgi:high-affinity iron transporter
VNKDFFSLTKIFSIKTVCTIFLFIGLLGSSHLFAQQSSLQLQEIRQQASQETNNSSNSLLKETRQILQLAEYIGVDYPAAVANGQISNKDEFAEMQQFANIIVDKISKLSANNSQLITLSLALQQAVNSKASATIIQQHSQEIRQQLLAISPALVLPKHLLANKETQTLFSENCAICHGETGQGNGNLARTLSPQPTDFTDKSRAINRSLLGLYDAITNGLEGSAMRSFANLSERQRWSLAFYVGGLAFKADAIKNAADKRASSTALTTITLPTWVNNNPKNLMKNNSLTLAQIASLRNEPTPLFKQNKAPLQTTKRNLLAAVTAYKANNLAQAQTLAVSAYLDGFELIENNLDAHDSVLRKSIESQLLNFRNLLKVADKQAQVESELAQILQQLQLAEQAMTMNTLSNNSMFSAALVILLREGLEALLVVIALATVLMKTKRQDALKYLHIGWVSALIAGFFTWWAAENLIDISGASREVMEGGAALLAALVLFYVGYWMHSKTQASQWQSYIKHNVDRHLGAGTLWGIASLAFISVYREVFETVLFYQSLLTQASTTQMTVVLSGFLTGVAILTLIAWLMIRYSVKLPLTKFFSVSAYFMLILAFILTGKGIAALQEAAIIGLSPFPIDISISWLGVAPTWQGLMAQATILALTALLMLKKIS